MRRSTITSTVTWLALGLVTLLVAACGGRALPLGGASSHQGMVRGTV